MAIKNVSDDGEFCLEMAVPSQPSAFDVNFYYLFYLVYEDDRKSGTVHEK